MMNHTAQSRLETLRRVNDRLDAESHALLQARRAYTAIEHPELAGSGILVKEPGPPDAEKQFRYVGVSPELARLNGRTVDEHLGASLREVLGDELGTTAQELMEDVWRGEKMVDRLVIGGGAGHSDVQEWVATYELMTTSDRGEPLAVVVLLRDARDLAKASDGR